MPRCRLTGHNRYEDAHEALLAWCVALGDASNGDVTDAAVAKQILFLNAAYVKAQVLSLPTAN